MKKLFYNAHIVSGGRSFDGWMLISGGTIVGIGKAADAPIEIDPQFTEFINCDGDLLMPGVIDPHVHFRDPGLTAKADMASESRAAAAGGVTTVFDMPNTKPTTTTITALNEKLLIASRKSIVNYAFFIGATNDNFIQLASAPYDVIPGIKLFLGSSTGNMLVNDKKVLEQLFASDLSIIAVHAEDEETIKRNRQLIEAEYGDSPVPVTLHSRLRDAEACVKATRYAVELAQRFAARLHLCHISTAREAELLDNECKVANKLITTETCPQYLLFTSEDLETRGSRLKCNPAIKTDKDRLALIEAVKDGRIDIIATDHAPHMPVDKEGDLFHAASGMPGVQFSLPLMLTLFERPVLVAKLMSHNPSTIFNVHNRGFLKKGYIADIVRVKHLKEPHIITDSEVISRCGWTPYAGCQIDYRIVSTWINGNLVYDNGTIVDNPPLGMSVKFDSLTPID